MGDRDSVARRGSVANVPFSKQLLRAREQKRPAGFWLGLFAGSLGLHLAMVFSMPYWLQPSESEAQAPLPVDIVDLSSAELGGGTADPNATVSDEASAIPFSAPPDSSQPPAFAVPPDVAQPSPVSAPPAPLPEPVQDPVPAPVQPEPIPPQDSPEPPPPQPPQPSPPIQGEVNLPSPTLPPAASPFPRDLASGGEESAEGSSETGEDTLPPGGTTNDALPDFGINSGATAVQVSANLTDVASLPPEELQDIPEVNAQPLEQGRTFTADPMDPQSCVVPPDSVAAFGEPISLRVVIDNDGRVVDAIPQPPSWNQGYTELARCAIQNWQFSPATRDSIPIYSDNLIVTVILQGQ